MIRRYPTLAALAAFLLLPCVSAAEESVVLVTNASCPVTQISGLDVKKVYLGVTVRLGERSIRPLRLNNDERLNQVFYQSVVAMSRKSYERRLLSLVLKFGTPRPAEFERLEDALATMRRVECAVVYGWKRDLEGAEDIKVLRVLWQG